MTEQEKRLLLVLLDEMQRNAEGSAKRRRSTRNSGEYTTDDEYEIGFADGQSSAYRYIAGIIRGDI